MIKCPFCHYDNEDGSLFCEQCRSDLSDVPPIAVPAPAASSRPSPSPIPGLPPVPPAMPPLPPIAPLFHESSPPLAGTPLVVEESAPPPFPPLPVADIYNPTPEIPPVVYEAQPVKTPSKEIPAVVPEEPPPPALEIPKGEHVPAAEPIEHPTPLPVKPEHAPPPPPEAPVVEAVPVTPATPVIPAGVEPALLVLRGQKRNVRYPIYEGDNFIGRADEKPVDIDLEDQEPADRVWCSRQHAVIHWGDNQLSIEDLNSSNGTYVNRAKIYPGQLHPLKADDIIQIGGVQMKVVL